MLCDNPPAMAVGSALLPNPYVIHGYEVGTFDGQNWEVRAVVSIGNAEGRFKISRSKHGTSGEASARARCAELTAELSAQSGQQTSEVKTMKTPESSAPPARDKKKSAAAVPRNASATTTASSSATRSAANPNNGADPTQGVRKFDPATIRRSPFNRDIDQTSPEFLKFLASVRTHGVMQNGIVRPVRPPEGKIEWELIAGEKRWTAATIAGIEFPAAVRDVDDVEALEIQAEENMQRENLNPLDEGRKFEQLRERYQGEMGMSKGEAIARIKEVTGMAESTIYGRMKLLELPDFVIAAVEAGTLPTSHAELVGRVDAPAAREALAKQIMTPKEVYNNGRFEKEVISYRDAKYLADLAAEEEKKEVTWQKQTEDYAAKGYSVLSLKKSEGIFSWNGLRAGYVGVNDECDLDTEKKKRTWKALLGEHAPTPIVARDRQSKPRVLFPRKAAEKALKKAGHEFVAAPAGSAKGDSQQSLKLKEDEKRKKEEERRKAEKERKLALAREHAGKLVAAVESREPTAEFFRLLVGFLAENSETDQILVRRGLITDAESESQTGWKIREERLEALIKKSDGKTLRGLAIELVLWSWDGLDQDVAQIVASAYKVKLQTSGKKKGACGATASVPGASGSFEEAADE